MMAPRLVELRRVLKPTGSLYLGNLWRRVVGNTRALLLAVPGGESPDPTPVRGDAPADLGATGPGRLTRGECKDAGLAKRGHK